MISLLGSNIGFQEFQNFQGVIPSGRQNLYLDAKIFRKNWLCSDLLIFINVSIVRLPNSSRKSFVKFICAAVSLLFFLHAAIQCMLLHFLAILLSTTSSVNHHMNMGAVCELGWGLSFNFFRLGLVEFIENINLMVAVPQWYPNVSAKAKGAKSTPLKNYLFQYPSRNLYHSSSID